ncbi:hypothetical protein JXD20_03865 [Candidatus Peregrinibacteria bacterium]|nr:hypothetical protein [Candidatus Peregrinibacteria bacterium]
MSDLANFYTKADPDFTKASVDENLEGLTLKELRERRVAATRTAIGINLEFCRRLKARLIELGAPENIIVQTSDVTACVPLDPVIEDPEVPFCINVNLPEPGDDEEWNEESLKAKIKKIKTALTEIIGCPLNQLETTEIVPGEISVSFALNENGYPEELLELLEGTVVDAE